MPQRELNGLRALSLFSGGGGLDFGFDRAGFDHVASYEIVTSAAQTLRLNRPSWEVFDGKEGDVTGVDWKRFRGTVDVIHGGPPCQPFSSAGRQNGHRDERNLFPEFVRAIRLVKPQAFVAENVRALGLPKFRSFLFSQVLGPLSREYQVHTFELRAPDFGVPQVRTRFFILGISRELHVEYVPPVPTHYSDHLSSTRGASLFACASSDQKLDTCMGARQALGLADIGFDALAPTLRSGLTGPRHTTSILSSVSALKTWNKLQIWPNGVSPTREQASRYMPDNGHFRLAVADCAILQGFSDSWQIAGPVYVAIGQIGNSVAPPVAYHLARSISGVLHPAL
jgi:DNA (cytosine-5)-methyltransferase 1